MLRIGRDLQYPAKRDCRTLRDRKIANIDETEPDVIAAGNIGCITQIASGTAIPVVHPIELIDWATGGPKPEQLKRPRQRLKQSEGDHGEEAKSRRRPPRRKSVRRRRAGRRSRRESPSARRKPNQGRSQSAGPRNPRCRRVQRRRGAAADDAPGPAVTPIAPRPSPFPSSVPGDFPLPRADSDRIAGLQRHSGASAVPEGARVRTPESNRLWRSVRNDVEARRYSAATVCAGLLDLKIDQRQRRRGLLQHAPALQPVVGPLHLVERDRRRVAHHDAARAQVLRR